MRKYHFFLVLILLAALLLPVSCGNTPDDSPGIPKAAIVDQLYLLEPDPSFIAEATRMLEMAGFEVDVWQGADITVDFYRKLSTMGYRFIVFRVHSGVLLQLKGEEVVEMENTYFFTSENYTSTRYVADQLSDKVSYAIMAENYPNVFAVNSELFRDAKGNYNRTVILAMGCESYRYDDLPKAFVEKGASAYIGWSGVVSLEHVDKVTLDLLKNLCTGGMAIADAVSVTMTDIGPDPYFDSFLKVYPQESGSRTVAELIK
jgi:hypothetical protein